MIHDLHFLILTCLYKFTDFHKRNLVKQFQLMNLVPLPQNFTPIPHFSYNFIFHKILQMEGEYRFFFFV